MRSNCATRRKLAEQFAHAARVYAETAVRLATLGTSGTDYIGLRGDTEEAHRRSETAFTAFSEHVASHECGEAALNGHGHLNAQEKLIQ